MVRKDAWNDFNFFEFTKARFMAQDVIYPGEGSVRTWEKGEIHCFGVKCPIDISIRSNWSIVSFKVCVSLLIFCLVDLSIGVSGVLKSPTIIVLLLISSSSAFWSKRQVKNMLSCSLEASLKVLFVCFL